MSNIGQSERETQNRVIALLRDELGYRYLGDWRHREDNRNIEEKCLTEYLNKHGYSDKLISHAMEQLRRVANTGNGLYNANKEVYKLLRYGANVRAAVGKRAETVHFINWQEPERNHFAVAEEVTLRGRHERRPDMVLYLNGIALAVLELKNSRVSVGEGIRQNISNQRKKFNAWFFSTVQFLFSGNDSEGLHYAPIEAQNKHFLRWKEESTADDSRSPLEQHLLQMCNKERFLDLIYDFVVFDGGIKKLPRPHQFFAVKAAQRRMLKRTGGIIWHTQGSGKSLVMILLARWILENIPRARVLIITDRRELDAQIRGMFDSADKKLERTETCADLREKLRAPGPQLLAALVHKFGWLDENMEFEQQIAKLQKNPPPVAGEMFVFVDECHRTESGKLHRIMKAMLSQAVFVGFTGTPLLRTDKPTSTEVFGSYIHTYKYDKAVADGVVLDLMYEARDIEQRLGSKEKINRLFEAKTSGLNKRKKDALQKTWATLRKVLSSSERIKKVAGDVVLDFGTQARLKSGRGTALLVAGSIYEAYKYYRAFADTELYGKCAVITSDPSAGNISREGTGTQSDSEREYIYNARRDMLVKLGVNNIEEGERKAKKQFIDEPARMRLLIVVDKLLTGFDAPSCTYLYIDKKMQNHGLFQAICRTNRLDSADKKYGCIVDYKNLFYNVRDAMAVYTAELAEAEDGGDDPQIRIQERLKKCRELLEEAREKTAMILEPVSPPKDESERFRYFCGNLENPESLAEKAPKREELYKAVAGFLRAHTNLVSDMSAAGYSCKDITSIKSEVENAVRVSKSVSLRAGEYLDTKPYESDMRYLIDNYIDAEESRVISRFDDMSLVNLLAQGKMDGDIDNVLRKIFKNEEVRTEVIANNVSIAIKQTQLNNPGFYRHMSEQLGEIIRRLREGQIDYAEFLRNIKKLARAVRAGHGEGVPNTIDTLGKHAMYEYFLEDNKENPDIVAGRALRVHNAVMERKTAYWSGNPAKESGIQNAIANTAGESHVKPLFNIVRGQKEYGGKNDGND